ncbi:predicted protein [Arabidopsis lyrata subsp. lyrata]|uniref:Predicted protein n=1 Tax=Arabidopsis lyrata subsp. lyrata TaxID=81972 RepID=D7LP27_ARALL|nr:predicted protein [Arabidopsis lyrata subsp. lyrata]
MTESCHREIGSAGCCCDRENYVVMLSDRESDREIRLVIEKSLRVIEKSLRVIEKSLRLEESRWELGRGVESVELSGVKNKMEKPWMLKIAEANLKPSAESLRIIEQLLDCVRLGARLDLVWYRIMSAILVIRT